MDWLPDLVLFDGDWDEYLEKIYVYFKADFVATKPKYLGKELALKKHPMADGKEATFWHMIQEGRIEEDRTPDIRRCERIRWPKPISHPKAQKEKTATRIRKVHQHPLKKADADPNKFWAASLLLLHLADELT